MKIGERFEALEGIMTKLRSDDGCPWDREGDPEAHCEELGDLLFQVVFQAQIRKEEGAFDLGDVAEAISDKLIRRHPHVFGDKKEMTREEIRANWASSKREERKEKGQDLSALAGIPKNMPALLRAERLGEKASTEGFDWSSADGVRRKLTEEIDELDDALNQRLGIEEEIGDVLFTVVNLCRHLNISPDQALSGANARFENRFRWVEKTLASTRQTVQATPPNELNRLWSEAKLALR